MNAVAPAVGLFLGLMSFNWTAGLARFGCLDVFVFMVLVFCFLFLRLGPQALKAQCSAARSESIACMPVFTRPGGGCFPGSGP